MKLFLAIVQFLIALAFVPIALDWRSPLLGSFRPPALLVLGVLTIVIIVTQLWVLKTSRPEQRLLRVFSQLALLAAALSLTTAVGREARFHWIRYTVLHTDPQEMEPLGRHIIVGYHRLSEVRKLVKIRAVGGVFLSTRNVRGKTAETVKGDIQSLQRLRHEQGLPRLWIATDQEGGVVSRLSPPLTHLPAISEIVKRCSDAEQCERNVRQFGEKHGRELASIGVNLNFAPVVDINYDIVNPHDRLTRVFKRAISGDPATVARVASWYCSSLEAAGVHCTLKHFPGLGRVFEDTHLNHASLATPVAELTATDWVPFRELMRNNGVFTMLAHVTLTAIDSDRPVSVSRPVITGMIRTDWNHDGILITDDFSMVAAYRSSLGLDEGAVEALNAGVDLLLVSYDCDQFYRLMYALLRADRKGKLDREALRRSDQRLERAAIGLRN